MTAFVVAGVSLAAGLGPASASTTASTMAHDDPLVPGSVSTCLLPLPLLCDEQPGDSWSGGTPAPHDSWSNAPIPDDSWSDAPKPQESWPGPEKSTHPWRPAGEREHKVPKGHPETGGGALAEHEPVWPFAVGGAALLAGAGLAGVAVRRRRDDARRDGSVDPVG
ncbi:hypothetical protein [Nonomuraea sp. NPDC050643]|uniref:hypothetical protein n=1 Tax=Nonomuraea sp. NPDC050643 TaxID=3155660 RepID=UPI0033D75D51